MKERDTYHFITISHHISKDNVQFPQQSLNCVEPMVSGQQTHFRFKSLAIAVSHYPLSECEVPEPGPNVIPHFQ